VLKEWCPKPYEVTTTDGRYKVQVNQQPKNITAISKLPSPKIHQERQNLDRAINYPYTTPTEQKQDQC